MTTEEFISETIPLQQQVRGFLYGNPRTATEKDLAGPWLCGKPGEYFRCALCGYKFHLGDYWRCQYTNSVPGAYGNPIVCKDCDCEDRDQLIEKWRKMHEEAKSKYWWFCR
jgi:hypothetical protein